MSTQPTTPYEKYAALAAENYERDFVPTIGEPFARQLLHAAELRSGERVLDIACGTGVVARLASKAVGPTGSVAGIDANPGMLEVARAASAGTPIEWHQAPAENLPIPDSSVDVALCSLGLMFFGDKPQAIREIRRVLSPGGRVIVGTPGPTPALFNAIDQALISQVGPGASMFVHTVFSVHEPAEVLDLLQGAELENIEIDKDTLSFRLPEPAEFFWQYVNSTPLIAIIGELDEGARAALEREVVERCQPFLVDGGLTMDVGVLIARAGRPSKGDR